MSPAQPFKYVTITVSKNSQGFNDFNHNVHIKESFCFFEIRNVVSFSSGNFDSLVLQIGELHKYSKLSNTKGFKYFRKWEAIDCKYVQIRLNELKSD